MLVSLVLIAPYYYDVFSMTNVSGSRLSIEGSNWFPFRCTDTSYCSTVFMTLAITLVASSLLFAEKKRNYLILMTLVTSATILLYHIVLYRYELISWNIQAHRFSSIAFIIYSIACAYSLSRINSRFLSVFVMYLMFFSGAYYAMEQGDRASFCIRRDQSFYKFNTWIRENIRGDPLFLIYDSSPTDMTQFYAVGGMEYALPSTLIQVTGTSWESGYISGTKNHELVIARVDEWLGLNKSDPRKVEDYISKNGIEYIIYIKDENTTEYKALENKTSLVYSQDEYKLLKVTPVSRTF